MTFENRLSFVGMGNGYGKPDNFYPLERGIAMKKFSVLVGRVAVVLACVWVVCVIIRSKNQEQPPDGQTSNNTDGKLQVKKGGAVQEPVAPTWPKNARFASVSQDGNTVAYMSGREIVVAVKGIEQYRVTSINMLHPNLRISDDGKYVAANCFWKQGTVLWNVQSPGAAKRLDDYRYHFVGNTICQLDVMYKKDEVVIPLPEVQSVKTQAIVSGDGRTVVVMDDGKATVLVEGKKVREFFSASLKSLAINHSGTRLVAFDTLPDGICIFETQTGKRLATHKAERDTIFKFSPCGRYLAMATPGEKHGYVVSSYDNYKIELRAISRIKVDYRYIDTEYPVTGCHWSNIEPEDVKPCVSFGISEHNAVQYQLLYGYWELNWVVYATLDQDFDFDKEGNLTEHARK